MDPDLRKRIAEEVIHPRVEELLVGLRDRQGSSVGWSGHIADYVIPALRGDQAGWVDKDGYLFRLDAFSPAEARRLRLEPVYRGGA